MKIKAIFITQILSIVFCVAQKMVIADSILLNRYSSVLFANSKIEYPTFDGFGDNHFPEFKRDCSNLTGAITIGANNVWPGGNLGLNLTGNSMNSLGIWDSGAIRGSHKEFRNRVTQIDGVTSLSSHSNGVAGVMIASGALPNAKGMSFRANLKCWDYNNDRSEMASAANGLLISNHSYANLAGWYYNGGYQYWLGDTALNEDNDWKFGFYDSRTATWDSISYKFPYYLIVKAIGNDRGISVAPGTPHYYWNGYSWIYSTRVRNNIGPYDCIVTYGTAKNILSVGAVDVLPNGYIAPPLTIFNNSSWGPTDDGRIKPDVVAGTPSSFTPSTAHDSSYQSLGGTSISSGAASGSLLLLQQHHFNLKNRYMKSSTLKGLAIHTANRCKTTFGPNYESGWGLLNISKSVQVLSDSNINIVNEYSLNNNDTFNMMVYVNGVDTAKATICWTDPPSVVTAPAYNDTTPKLINDLDLRLLSMSNGQEYKPYILNPNNPSAAATNGDNYRDNVEQIYGLGLAQGFYKIRVSHKRNLQNNQPQDFSFIGSNLTATPSEISLTNSNIPLVNIYKGTYNAVLYKLDVSVLKSATALNELRFTSSGSYTASDISNFKIWYHNDSNFNSGAPQLLSTLTNNLGGGIHNLTGLSKILNIGSNYIFITSDIPCTSLGSSISINLISTSDIKFVWGAVSGAVFTSSNINILSSDIGAIASPSTRICFGDTVTLFGTGASSYYWDNGVFDAEAFVPTSTASYTVFGTDDYGCDYDTTITIVVNSLPNVGISVNPSIHVCLGSNVTLSGTGASSYKWGGGIVNATSFIPSYSPSSYIVTGLDSITGCRNVDSVTIYINPSIKVSASNFAICLGDSVTLSATGGVSYLWSPSSSIIASVGSSVSAMPQSTTTYTSVGTDSSGCVTKDSITVQVFSAPPGNPLSFSSSNISNQSFDLDWTPTANTLNYSIDVSIDSSFNTILPGYNGLRFTSTHTSISGLTAGTTYYARIKSVNSCYHSSYVVDTILLKPNPPLSLNHTSLNLNDFTANWSTSNGASFYLLDVSLDKDFTTLLAGYNSLSVIGTNKFINGLTIFTKYYYRVRAVNPSGISSYSVVDSLNTLSLDVHLYLTAYLEGFYLGSSNMTASPFNADGVSPINIADTIIVELHEDLLPFTLAYSTKAILKTNGFSDVLFSGTGANGNNYYVVVRHRNSIAIWSAVPVAMSNAGVSYDFSSSQTQAAGDNLKDDGNGIFLIYSGDLNQDGSVDFNDYPFLDIGSSNGDLGYLATDLNGDASVDFNDYPLIDVNGSLGIIEVTP
jgi:hypothetical protein